MSRQASLWFLLAFSCLAFSYLLLWHNVLDVRELSIIWWPTTSNSISQIHAKDLTKSDQSERTTELVEPILKADLVKTPPLTSSSSSERKEHGKVRKVQNVQSAKSKGQLGTIESVPKLLTNEKSTINTSAEPVLEPVEEDRQEPQNQEKPENREKQENPVKLILLWSNHGSVYGGNDFSNDVMMSECPNKNKCQLTTVRSLVDTASAVLFHWSEAVGGMSLPPKRHPWQRYVLMSIESAGYYPASRRYENQFNWTLTYRRDSTFPLVYGFCAEGPPKGFRLEIVKKVAEGKRKIAAWFVSNCFTPSRREAYVTLLKKHIPIDIYGACGTSSCPRQDMKPASDCHKMVERDYFFYLGFENSICRDYVTEKMLKFLTLNVVPVVLSRWVASGVVPNSSFIAVDDFKSPKDLANYLQYLTTNVTAYMEYFKWKETKHAVSWHNWAYESPEAAKLGYCALCSALHNASWPSQTISLQKWWSDDAKCKSVDV